MQDYYSWQKANTEKLADASESEKEQLYEQYAMTNRPIVFFDLETTGLNVADDRIVSIALRKYSFPELIFIDKFVTLVNPERLMSQEVIDVHKITNEMLVDAPKFTNIANGILAFIDGCNFGTFNGNNFDIPMLRFEFLRVGIELDMSKYKSIDVKLIESKVNSHRLGACYERYTGKPVENWHDADADVETTVEVFKQQISKHNLEADVDKLIGLYDDGSITYVDIERKLYYTKDDPTIRWNFGKNNKQPVKSDFGYANWVLGNKDFSIDLKNHVRRALS